jgi:hypothetical protein
MKIKLSHLIKISKLDEDVCRLPSDVNCQRIEENVLVVQNVGKGFTCVVVRPMFDFTNILRAAFLTVFFC